MPRWEDTTTGRAVISVALATTLAAIVATNLPTSQTRTALMTWARPYLYATGLDQNWGVFAPNPRNYAAHLRVRIERADGSVATWELAARPGTDSYVDYRWHKFAEQLWRDDRRWLWRPFAEHVAARDRAGGGDPVKVTLIREWAALGPPGPGPDLGRRRQQEYFSLAVGAGS